MATTGSPESTLSLLEITADLLRHVGVIRGGVEVRSRVLRWCMRKLTVVTELARRTISTCPRLTERRRSVKDARVGDRVVDSS